MKKLLNWLVRAVVLLLSENFPQAADGYIGMDPERKKLLTELDEIKRGEPTLFDE